MPHVCSRPVETLAQIVAVPTWVGTSRLPTGPIPSSPWTLAPQHHGVWSVRIPHVWVALADTLPHGLTATPADETPATSGATGPAATPAPDMAGGPVIASTVATMNATTAGTVAALTRPSNRTPERSTIPRPSPGPGTQGLSRHRTHVRDSRPDQPRDASIRNRCRTISRSPREKCQRGRAVRAPPAGRPTASREVRLSGGVTLWRGPLTLCRPCACRARRPAEPRDGRCVHVPQPRGVRLGPAGRHRGCLRSRSGQREPPPRRPGQGSSSRPDPASARAVAVRHITWLWMSPGLVSSRATCADSRASVKSPTDEPGSTDV